MYAHYHHNGWLWFQIAKDANCLSGSSNIFWSREGCFRNWKLFSYLYKKISLLNVYSIDITTATFFRHWQICYLHPFHRIFILIFGRKMCYILDLGSLNPAQKSKHLQCIQKCIMKWHEEWKDKVDMNLLRAGSCYWRPALKANSTVINLTIPLIFHVFWVCSEDSYLSFSLTPTCMDEYTPLLCEC
jgi:hypothetical protein